MKDWRGTPIEIGSKVVAHALGKYPSRAIGTVARITPTKMVSVEVLQRDSSWSSNKYMVVGPSSVTVITEGMFDGS